MQQQDELPPRSEEQNRRRRPVVVVLCGLIGSGKSSFATAVEEYRPEYVRCNQDVLGSRNAVKARAIQALHAGYNVIIDRTNVDESQRATWVDLARTFAGAELQAIVFQTPLEICKARLALRTDHETIRDPAHAIDVLLRFHRHFSPPAHTEGFRRIIAVHPSDFVSPKPTAAEVEAVLDRVAQAPLVNVAIVRRAETSRPNRGRGGRWTGGGQRDQRQSREARGPYRGHQRPSAVGTSGIEPWQPSGGVSQAQQQHLPLQSEAPPPIANSQPTL